MLSALVSRLRNALHPVPGSGQQHLTLLVSLTLAWALGFAAHMLDYPKWDTPACKIDGEFIQATHDAYHWLAGALGTGEGQNSPLAWMARWAKDILDIAPGNFGFFAPAVAAGLVGAAVVLLAWTMGCVEAGLAAGLFAMLAPGFFYRTRLGFYDTDMVTLLFPLLLCWGLAHWLRPHLQPDWKSGLLGFLGRHKNTHPPESAPPGLRSLLGLLVFGGVARFFGSWHGHIELFSMLLFCMALGLALFMGLPDRRGRLLLGLVVFGLCAYLGRFGLFAAAGLTALAAFRPSAFRLFTSSIWPGAVLAAAILLQAGLAQELWQGGVRLLENYGRKTSQTSTVTSQETAETVTWPKVMQSVVEAKDIGWRTFFLRIHPFRWLAVTGLVGFVAALAFRPLLIFLLPLFVLSLASVMLGGRMAMFAGPVAGLGLAMPLCWLGRAVLPRKAAQQAPWPGPTLTAVLGLAALLLLSPSLQVFAALRPMPVLHKQHALALKKLGNTAPTDAMVWTWWDWGYAVNYYAGLSSYADGGTQTGKRVYPLALALTTPSSRQAAQVIDYCASIDYTPWKTWQNLRPQEMEDLLVRLGTEDIQLQPKPPQYLVVTMSNLHLLRWITYYGSWNFQRQTGDHARLVLLNQTFDVDYEKGLIRLARSGLTMRLKSADIIHQGRLHHWDFPQHPDGQRLVVEDSGGHYYLMDDLAYMSQAVQLLLADPQSPAIANHLKLVHDGFPVVRIYKTR